MLSRTAFCRSHPTLIGVFWAILVAASAALLLLGHRWSSRAETWKLFIDDRAYAPLSADFNCTVVWLGLERLYTETLLRQSHLNVTPSVRDMLATTSEADIVDIHVLFLGDSWAQRAALAASRALHLCRRQLPPSQPSDVEECGLSYGTPERIHDVTYLSLAALNFSVPQEDTVGRGRPPHQRLRFHTHYERRRFLVQAARAIVHETYALDSGVAVLRTTTFPPQAQCASPWRTPPAFLSRQLPWCACETTMNRPGNVNHTVALSAVQVLSGMWDIHRPERVWDLFSFHEEDINWFRQQQSQNPNLARYPHLTWEQNLARFQAHLLANFTQPFRSLAAHVTEAGTAIPPAPLLLSVLPPVNCSGPKFYRTQGRRNVHQCTTLLHPLHEIIAGAVDAVFDAPLHRTNQTSVAGWLRRVDYHHGVYPSVCTMSDGVHLDAAKLGFSDGLSSHHCSALAHLLFWHHI